MRLPRTLSAYALGEVLLYSVLGLVALASLLIGRNLLRHLDDLVRAGSSANEIGIVVACLAVTLATYAVPVAFLFGVLLAVGRLAGDGEITAMQSCGVGLPSIVIPIALLGLVFTGGTAYLTNEIEHRAQRLLRLTVQRLAAEGRLVEPGEFRRVGDRVLFVREQDSDGRLRGIVIADRSNPARPLLIFAEQGELEWDSQRSEIQLRLFAGTIHLDSDGEAGIDSYEDQNAGVPQPVATASASPTNPDYRRIVFKTFDYAFSADDILGVSLDAHRPREMSNSQLRGVIARAKRGESLEGLRRQEPIYYQLQLQRRLALPIAPILFALVGVPLALGPARRGRSRGLLLCAITAFAYYALLTFGQSLARDAAISATAAAWLPNIVFAGIATLLLYRTARPGGFL